MLGESGMTVGWCFDMVRVKILLPNHSVSRIFEQPNIHPLRIFVKNELILMTIFESQQIRSGYYDILF